MTEPQFIVERLVAVRPDGSRFDVTLRVGKPRAEKGPHGCAVQVSPFDAEPVRIFGEGPMQALFLGLRYIRLRLIAEEEDRGVRFYHYEPGRDPAPTDEPADWRHFWFGDPPRPEAV